MNYAVIVILLFCCSLYSSDQFLVNSEPDTFSHIDVQQKKKEICQKRCVMLFALGWTYAVNVALTGITIFLSIAPCKDSSARPATTSYLGTEEAPDYAKMIKLFILPVLYVVYTGSIVGTTVITKKTCSLWKKNSELLEKITKDDPRETAKLLDV